MARFAFTFIVFTTALYSQEKIGSLPNNIDSVASALYSEGNYWKVMEISKQYDADSLSPKFLFSLGMSYAALSEPQRAQEYLRRALSLDSTKLQYRFQYARLLSQTGLYQEAVDQLTRCVAMDSTYIPARFQLGLTYAAQKKHPEKEIEIFTSLIERNPNDFLSLYYISDALKRSGNTDSAAIFLRLSFKANPRYIPVLIALSNYLTGKKQYAEALPYYRTADSLRSDNKDLKFQIGECYRKLNDLPNAKVYFKRSIALDSTNALYHAQLAYAYYSAEQYDSSAASYQQAIANDDENAQYYMNLALVYKKLTMTELVIQTYKSAIRVRHPELIAYVYNDLAAFCMEKLLWRNAIEAYQQSLDVNPELVDPYYFMGTCFMQLPDNHTAIQMFSTYLKKTENNPEKKGERYTAQKMIEYLKTAKKNK